MDIEIGRWCNMTCRHCYKGEREKMACKPEYIDKFLDNIYLVNHLYFCGGEASLYIDEMRQILEIFKKKDVPINHIRVNSNLLVRCEKFVDFMNSIGEYSTHPEKVKLLISKDRFHLDNMREMGIDTNKYEETKQWYRERLLDNIVYSENTNSQWRLALEGRAVDIPKEELSGFLLDITDYDKMKKTFIEDEEIIDKKLKMKNAFERVMVSSEGYIFFNDNLSYENQRKSNHELSIGHVYTDTLENLIMEWNKHCDNKESYTDIVQGGLYQCVSESLKLIDKARELVYSNNDEGLRKLKNEAEKQNELYKKELNHFIDRGNEYNINNSIILNALAAVTSASSLIDLLLNIPNGFWRKMGMKVFDIYYKDK